METQKIDLSDVKGSVEIKVPGGTVYVSSNSIDARTNAPLTMVHVESRHTVCLDDEERLWALSAKGNFGGDRWDITLREVKYAKGEARADG